MKPRPPAETDETMVDPYRDIKVARCRRCAWITWSYVRPEDLQKLCRDHAHDRHKRQVVRFWIYDATPRAGFVVGRP